MTTTRQQVYRLDRTQSERWRKPEEGTFRADMFEQFANQTKILTNGVDTIGVVVLDCDGKPLDSFYVEPWTPPTP